MQNLLHTKIAGLQDLLVKFLRLRDTANKGFAGLQDLQVKKQQLIVEKSVLKI